MNSERQAFFSDNRKDHWTNKTQKSALNNILAYHYWIIDFIARSVVDAIVDILKEGGRRILWRVKDEWNDDEKRLMTNMISLIIRYCELGTYRMISLIIRYCELGTYRVGYEGMGPHSILSPVQTRIPLLILILRMHYVSILLKPNPSKL